jgi:hypothetical protein
VTLFDFFVHFFEIRENHVVAANADLLERNPLPRVALFPGLDDIPGDSIFHVWVVYIAEPVDRDSVQYDLPAVWFVWPLDIFVNLILDPRIADSTGQFGRLRVKNYDPSGSGCPSTTCASTAISSASNELDLPKSSRGVGQASA